MDLLDVNPKLIKALQRAGVETLNKVLHVSCSELTRLSGLSVPEIEIVKKAAARHFLRQDFVSALQILQNECPPKLQLQYLSTGCKVLDAFLQGGLITKGINEIAGVSASGKTQLCLQLSLTSQLPVVYNGLSSGVVYICTEDAFPNKRLFQMISLLKGRSKANEIQQIQFSDNIFIEHSSSVDELLVCLRQKLPLLLQNHSVRLLILDSIAALFRSEYDASKAIEKSKKLGEIASELYKLNYDFNLAVVCVNQVTGKFGDNASTNSQDNAALGLAWSNLVTSRFLLSRTEQSIPIKDNGLSYSTTIRKIQCIFSPNLPQTSCYFYVDKDGVKGIS